MRFILLTMLLFLTAGEVKVFGNTQPKISGINCRFDNGAYETEMLFSEKLCVTFCTSDEDEADSVFLKAINLPLGSSFRVLNPGAQIETAKLCFTPEKEPNIIDTIKFKIIAYNTKGSNATEVEQEFVIYVHQLADFTIDAKWENCGLVTVNAFPKNKVPVKYWMFKCNDNTIIADSNVKSVQFKNIKSGNASITVTASTNNGYNPHRQKEILIENGAPFWINNYELKQCQAEELKVDIDDFKRPTATYKWLGFKQNELIKTFNRNSDTIYQITGVDGTCADTLTLYHNVLNLDQKFTKSHQSGSAPKTVTFDLDGKSDADLFTIDYGDGTSEDLGAKDFPVTYNYTQPKTYKPVIICYKNRVNRCSQTFAFNPINIYPTSINENETGISIYPNPTSGTINIQSNTALKKVRIFNNVGQLILESTNTVLNISFLPKGLYVIELELENRDRIKKNIILN